MAQRPTHVPKFGNWDANDHAPYTRVFETARAGRGGKLINPNDPAENPEAFAPTVAKPPPAPAKQQNDADARRPRQDRASKDEAEFRRYMESPARKQVAQSPGHQLQPGRTTSSSDNQYPRRAQNGGESPYHRYAGDRSPLHPQARKVGSASPGPAINSVPSRSRTRSGRAEEPVQSAPTLPKFGEWDAKDPASGDGFTVIFNNARSEKKAGGAGRIPEMQVGMAPDNRNGSSANYAAVQKPSKNSNWFCCFS